MTKPYISVDVKGLREVIKDNDFVISGAGKQGVRILRFLLPQSPKYITDIRPSKWGLNILGCKVVPPSYFRSNGCRIVVCSSLNYFIIANQLEMKKGDHIMILPPVEILYEPNLS